MKGAAEQGACLSCRRSMIADLCIMIRLAKMLNVDRFAVVESLMYHQFKKKMLSSGVRLSNIEIEQAIQASLRGIRYIPLLKEEQKLCLQSVEKRRDVFGIPPTGFEKTLIFQLLPCVTKETWKIERSTVLVVSPLMFNMKD